MCSAYQAHLKPYGTKILYTMDLRPDCQRSSECRTFGHPDTVTGTRTFAHLSDKCYHATEHDKTAKIDVRTTI